MKLFIENMNEEIAKDILSWEYEKPYDFYNNELTDEDLKEKLDGSYYALVNDQKELFVFFVLVRMLKFLLGKKVVFIQMTQLIWD